CISSIVFYRLLPVICPSYISSSHPDLHSSPTRRSSDLGFWKKDAYVGQIENPYRKIDKSANVSSYTINKVQDDINNLRFYVRVNQEQQDYPGFSFVVHSGRYQTQINNNDFVELTNVTFPIKLKANYGR